MSERLYMPKDGQRVKFRYETQFIDQLRCAGVNSYAWYRVATVEGTIVHVRHAPVPNDPLRDEPTLLSVPLELVQPPTGWAPKYTIYVTDRDKADTVVNNWFTRGIVVRFSQDLSCAGNSTYQPLDNSQPVHWQYGEVTDTVLAEDCAQVFRVVFVIEEEINGYANPEHPKLSSLTPKERKSVLEAMRKEGWRIEYFKHSGGGYMRRKDTLIHDWAA